jgi:hypothetical protein
MRAHAQMLYRSEDPHMAEYGFEGPNVLDNGLIPPVTLQIKCREGFHPGGPMRDDGYPDSNRAPCGTEGGHISPAAMCFPAAGL